MVSWGLKRDFLKGAVTSDTETDLENDFFVKNCPYNCLVCVPWCFTDEISDLVNSCQVSRVKQQISADFGTFLDVQTLLKERDFVTSYLK